MNPLRQITGWIKIKSGSSKNFADVNATKELLVIDGETRTRLGATNDTAATDTTSPWSLNALLRRLINKVDKADSAALNEGIKIVLNGTPVTGEALTNPGFGGIGWLSYIRKTLSDKFGDTATTNTVIWLLRGIYDALRPKTNNVFSMTTGKISTNAIIVLQWATYKSYQVPNGQIWEPKYLGLQSQHAGVQARVAERMDFGSTVANAAFVDGLAGGASEYWDEVDLEVVVPFAGGVDPIPVNVTYNDKNGVSRTINTSLVRRGAVAGARYPVPIPAGQEVRDVTNMTAVSAGATAGQVAVRGYKELASVGASVAGSVATAYPKGLAAKGDRMAVLEYTADGGGGITFKATTAGTLETEA